MNENKIFCYVIIFFFLSSCFAVIFRGFILLLFIEIKDRAFNLIWFFAIKRVESLQKYATSMKILRDIGVFSNKKDLFESTIILPNYFLFIHLWSTVLQCFTCFEYQFCEIALARNLLFLMLCSQNICMNNIREFAHKVKILSTNK